MKRGKNLIAIILCLAMCYIPMQAAGYYKTKKVQYGGVNIYYNGMYQNAASQAIIIDGTTYLPVKALGNMLGLGIDWNQETKAVIINKASSNLSAQAEIAAKDYEIAALRKELETLKNGGVVVGTGSTSSTSNTSANNNFTSTKGTSISSSDLTATRRALENEYGDYFIGIDFDFSLSLSSSKIRVTISINDSSDYREFNRLSRSQVKNFVGDVCSYIRARHDDIPLSGSIEYRNSDQSLYSFTYSKYDSLSFSDGYIDSDSTTDSRLLNILNKTSTLSLDGYSSGLTINQRNVSVNHSLDQVTFSLYVTTSSEMKTVWNNHLGSNNNSSSLRRSMRTIADELNDELDYEIIGYIYIYGNNERIARYYFEDDDLYMYFIK